MNWKDELKKLQYPYMTVDLVIDGHKVSYESFVSKMKIKINWYYNGRHLVEYLDVNNEIGKLFGKPVFEGCSTAIYKRIKKWEGMKAAEKYKSESKATILLYSSFWASPAQIIRHLSKRFEKIEVLTETY